MSQTAVSSSTTESDDAVVSRAAFVRLFAAVMLPIFLAAVDQTLLAAATPAIARDLGDFADSAWIAVGYLLASTIMAPLYGRLGDRYGRRDALMAALGLFALGSLACAAAQGMWWLIGARLLQGLGGGGLMVMSQALIGEVVPPRQRPRFQAYFGVVFVLASVTGPVLGGLVVSHFSWRWLFIGNLPLAVLAVWRVSRLPASARYAQPGQSHDALGVLLFAASASTLLLWLTLAGHRFAWASLPSALMAGTALVLGIVLFWRERRHPHPFLPLELLHLPAIGWTAATMVLFAAGLFALVFFLPVYLQVGHATGAAHAGLLLLPLTAGLVLGSNATGRVVARTGRPDVPARWGLSVAAMALGLLGVVPAAPWVIGALGVAAGLGFGTVMPTAQLVVQTVAGRSRLGAAAATVSLARSTGAAVGTAVFGALVFGLTSSADLQAALHTADPAAAQSVIRAFHLAFFCAGGLTLLAAWTSTRVPRVTI
ncbi:MAG: MFS transporter [Thiomonas arsenitoxydans]|uniref:MFS transporter n=1 Tax=Thiomonas arsenitoxydans (strain DSM 22701 / CIP 110005 / 3As) TaxID=426114 RepID=A0A8I1MUZ5_THIA3|nr:MULTISPECIES: MFS transporter [Thiomonas]MBN8743335.1 MFS transporter [Thiomonas arsenitoxydans]ODU98414.1 MAG: MFS transporter [Thiomonas sp. SCN 64-16]